MIEEMKQHASRIESLAEILVSGSSASPSDLMKQTGLGVDDVYDYAKRSVDLAWDGERWLPSGEVERRIRLVDVAGDGKLKDIRECTLDDVRALEDRCQAARDEAAENLYEMREELYLRSNRVGIRIIDAPPGRGTTRALLHFDAEAKERFWMTDDGERIEWSQAASWWPLDGAPKPPTRPSYEDED